MRTLNSIQPNFCAALLLAGCAFLLMAGCNGKLQPAFTGVFVHQAQSEFSMASDTLHIEQAGENNYLIHRRTGIRLLDETGHAGKLILEQEEWKAELDTRTGLLTERSKGRQLCVDEHSLTLEAAVYKRLP